MAEDLEGGKKALDVSDEIASFEGEEVEEVLLHARDLMNIFVKTIKAFRLYPPENPALTSADGHPGGGTWGIAAAAVAAAHPCATRSSQ